MTSVLTFTLRETHFVWNVVPFRLSESFNGLFRSKNKWHFWWDYFFVTASHCQKVFEAILFDWTNFHYKKIQYKNVLYSEFCRVIAFNWKCIKHQYKRLLLLLGFWKHQTFYEGTFSHMSILFMYSAINVPLWVTYHPSVRKTWSRLFMPPVWAKLYLTLPYVPEYFTLLISPMEMKDNWTNKSSAFLLK